ncbi:MAG TPA: hypothetical protein VFM75_05080 [Modicisalibacter sp.]|nr:hypothetical protein [Modicisalibacter sp.]
MGAFVLAFVFLWFLIGGIAHFAIPGLFMSAMPDYLPLHREAVLVSGFFELLGAAGLLLPKWRRWAGNGLILLVVLVTPVNVHMWLHPAQFPAIPEVLLELRLIVQILLIVGIWWVTRPYSAAPVAGR